MLPACSNSVGHHVVSKHTSCLRTVWYEEANQFASYPVKAQTYNVGESWKQAPGNSPITYLGWMPWRNPTTYSRQIQNIKLKKGIVKWKEGPFPGWNPNMYHHYQDEGTYVLGPQDVSHPMADINPNIVDTNGHRQSVVKALLKLNDGAVNYAQALAESRETAGMLADAGQNFWKLLKAVKRGNLSGIPSNLRDVTRDASNIWLQWRYGWRPLAADIHGMYTFAKEGLLQPLILSGHSSVPESFHSKFKDYYGQDVTFRTRHRNGCKLWGRIDDPALFAAQNMGLVNPLSLGWELVPLSFVVDWFVPVGSFLECLTAASGISFVAGYANQSRQSQFDIEGTPGSATVERFTFHRAALSEFPDGKIYANQQPFNTERIADFLALLRQGL